MATDTWVSEAFYSDNAEWQTWAQRIHTALIACGLVATSDTGQVDLTTAARPATTAYAGYKVYRFNDALQATKPVFIRLEYGTGGVLGMPALKLTVGTGTNGAGTITGQMCAVTSLYKSSGARADEALAQNYVSGDGSRITACVNLWETTPGHALLIDVERLHDAAGDDTGEGFWVSGMSAILTTNQVVPYVGTVGSNQTSLPCLIPPRDEPFGAGGGVNLLPIRPNLIGEAPPLKGLLVYRHSDIAELAPISVDHYGAAHTYMPLGDGALPAAGGGWQGLGGAHSACAVAMLYE